AASTSTESAARRTSAVAILTGGRLARGPGMPGAPCMPCAPCVPCIPCATPVPPSVPAQLEHGHAGRAESEHLPVEGQRRLDRADDVRSLAEAVLLALEEQVGVRDALRGERVAERLGLAGR